jgi:hypothetical protein
MYTLLCSYFGNPMTWILILDTPGLEITLKYQHARPLLMNIAGRRMWRKIALVKSRGVACHNTKEPIHKLRDLISLAGRLLSRDILLSSVKCSRVTLAGSCPYNLALCENIRRRSRTELTSMLMQMSWSVHDDGVGLILDLRAIVFNYLKTI